MNLLEQHGAHSRSSSNVKSSALHVGPGLQVPELVFPMSSLEISDSELVNPVFVSCNLGCFHLVSLLSGSKFHHLQSWRDAGYSMD